MIFNAILVLFNTSFKSSTLRVPKMLNLTFLSNLELLVRSGTPKFFTLIYIFFFFFWFYCLKCTFGCFSVLSGVPGIYRVPIFKKLEKKLVLSRITICFKSKLFYSFTLSNILENVKIDVFIHFLSCTRSFRSDRNLEA